jgi:hypothetical protein
MLERNPAIGACKILVNGGWKPITHRDRAATELPLLHRMEERAGERRIVFGSGPLSSILSPLVPRRERRKT